jgi:DNA-binding FrmR family transcriptional regulator
MTYGNDFSPIVKCSPHILISLYLTMPLYLPIIASVFPPRRGWGQKGQIEFMLDSERKQTLINRLKSIEGHVRGIERMVEEDAYCMDILKQVKAVQQALERVSALTLENHLNTCVTTAIRSEDEAEKARVVTEIMDVFKATGKL